MPVFPLCVIRGAAMLVMIYPWRFRTLIRLARRGSKEVELGLKSDDMSSAGRQSWSYIAGLVSHQHDGEDYLRGGLKFYGRVLKTTHNTLDKNSI